MLANIALGKKNLSKKKKKKKRKKTRLRGEKKRGKKPNKNIPGCYVSKNIVINSDKVRQLSAPESRLQNQFVIYAHI